MIGRRRAMMIGGSRGLTSRRGVGRGGPFGIYQASWTAGGHRAKWPGSAALRRAGDGRGAVAVPNHPKRAHVSAAPVLPSGYPARGETARTARAHGAPNDDVGRYVG